MTDLRKTPLRRLLLLSALMGGASLVEDTATGNPVTFETDVAKPLVSLEVPFTPIQEGSGDPSPQNIRSILPWDGLKVYHSGADTSNPTETDISFPSPVYGGTLDVVSGVLTVKYAKLAVKKTQFGNKNTGSVDYRQAVVSTDLINLDDASNWELARARQKFNLGLIANPYSESSFGNYIGVTYSTNNRSITMRISEDIYQSMSDDDYAEIVYRLATPQEITLTPEQITALVGDNTIWSDADGSMTAVYLKKG